MSAALYVVQRMQRDPRLAYLLGPGSEAFEQLTAEAAAHLGAEVKAFRAELAGRLTYEAWPTLEVTADHAPDDLRRSLCGIGIVGAIEGHDVIRRDSMLDLVDRRRGVRS
jgi:hypothetical protein